MLAMGMLLNLICYRYDACFGLVFREITILSREILDVDKAEDVFRTQL